MAGTGGDDWVYVLSQQDAAVEYAEAEQAVTADAITTTVTADAADNDKKASAQPSELDNKEAAPSSLSEYKDCGGGAQSYSDDDEYPADWYTPEEAEVEKTYDAYMASLDRALACKVEDELVEKEMGRAYAAYVAALDRRAAAKIDGRLIDSRLIEEALRTYRAAGERAAKILGDGAASSSNAGGGRRPRAVVEEEKPRHDDPYTGGDTYGGAEPVPYYPGYGDGSSAPASLGSVGSGYDYTCYNRYGFGFGFPGAAYGPATASGYGSYGYEYYGYGFPGAGAYGPAIGSDYGFGYPGTGYGYGGYAEPYAPCPSYSYVPPGYQTTAVYLAPPPPALNATSFF